MSGENYFLQQSNRCSEISESAISVPRMLAYRALRRDYDEQAVIARLMSLSAEIDRISEFEREIRAAAQAFHAKKDNNLLLDSGIRRRAVDIFERGIYREIILCRRLRPR